MNPLLKKHLQELDGRIDTLRDLLAKADDRARKYQQERQELLEDQLRKRKELVTLQHKGDQFDTLAAENDRLAATQAELQQRLRKVLSLVRSLATELKS